MENKLSNASMRLVFSNTLFRGARNVFQIFLNIYIFSLTRDLKILAIFNSLFYAGRFSGFFISSFFVKAGFRRLINLISYSGFVFIFLLVIVLGEKIISSINLISFVYGVFTGIYFMTLGINQFDLTNFKNRGNYEGIKKAFKTSSKIIFPAIFGFVIGFYNIQIAFFVGIFFLIISYLISNVNIENSSSKTRYREFLKIVFSNKKVAYSFIGSLFFTFAFSLPLIELIVPIFIYNEVGNELELGFALSFLGFLSIIISYIFGKFIDYKSYNKSLIILLGIYIISLLSIIYFKSYNLFLILSSIISGVITMYSIGTNVIATNAIHSIKNYDEYKVEYLVFKEVAFSVGWMLSFVIMYFAGDMGESFYKFIFSLMIIFSIFATLFLIKINMHEIEE